MGDVICTCRCGRQMRVSEFAVGASERCPGCGATVPITEENTAPIDEAGPDTAAAEWDPSPSGSLDAEDTAAGQETTGDQCSRCGRAFRGEWDRHECALGILCNICFNLAATQDKLRVMAAADAKTSGGGEAVSPDPAGVTGDGAGQQTPDADDDLKRRAEWERRKQAFAAIAGVAVVLVTIYLVFTTEPLPERDAADAVQQLADREYPAALGWFAMVLRQMLRFAAFHAAIYTALRFSNAYVTAGFLQDQFPLIFKSFGVWLFWAVIGWLVMQFPLVGPALWLFCFVITMMMVYLILDMAPGDILMFCVFWLVFAWVAPMVGVLILGPLTLLLGP